MIVNLLVTAQSNNGGSLGGPLLLVLPSALPSSESMRLTVDLPHRNMTLSELQRLRRQFVSVHKKAVTQGMAGKAELDWSEETVANKFVAHLEANLRS